ncbi:MAG: hypothetical protein ACREF0_11875, partial [Acetobacteraceae bacterium]
AQLVVASSMVPPGKRIEGCHRFSTLSVCHLLLHPIALELLRAALDAAQRDEARTESILRERASIPDDILGGRRTREVYLTAQEALSYGLVHEIANFTLPPGNKIFQI